MVTEIEVPRQIRRARDFLWTASQCEFQAFAERRFFFGCRHGAIVHFGRHAPGNRSGEMYPAGVAAHDDARTNRPVPPRPGHPTDFNRRAHLRH
ncbi:hypothetical protein [Burkholderia ubonensis]|uniref:hypothetical protein n=1 Tax=Burkholderia ubonensis TaxID=101571 RepID=UPI0018AD2B46|nr:hypothetical protein [Burkholderia ubonensis]